MSGGNHGPTAGPAVLATSLLEAEVLGQALDVEAPGNQAVVLVDPGATQWEAARALGDPVVVVMRDFERASVAEALEAGAQAVVAADSSLDDLREVLARTASAGSRPTTQALPDLTVRERQILASIAAGGSVKETAASLGISVKTVENLQRRMFRKLGARNRPHAVRQGMLLGVLEPVEGAAFRRL